LKIAIEADLSLENTLLSSFACYLFRETKTPRETIWIGQAYPFEGVRLRQTEGIVEIESQGHSQTVLDYLKEDAIGLWHEPNLEDVESSKTLQELAQRIVPGIRVPRLHRNKWHILLSALLSIHAKVSYSRAWFLSLAKYSLRELQTMSPSELRDHTRNMTGISAGFRMRYLTELVNDLFEKYPDAEDPLEELCKRPAPELRVQLLQLRNLGPKVCDCFLLNAIGDLSSSPIDVHVRRVSEYLGILPAGLGMPVPSYCRGYVCSKDGPEAYGLPTCPRVDRTAEYLEEKLDSSGTCIRAAMTHKFKQAGWVQAILFLFGQRFCARTPRGEPDCSNCPMGDKCLRDVLPPVVQTHRVRLRIFRPRVVTPKAPQFPELPFFQLYPEVKGAVDIKSREIFDRIGQKLRGEKNIMGTCLWLACRLMRLPVLIDEVALAYSMNSSDILRSYEQIREQANLRIDLADPKLYIGRLQRALKLPENVISLANLIANASRGRCLNPVSLAAASVFLAARRLDFHIRQEDISKQLSLTQPTVRNVAKKMVISEKHRNRT